MDAESYPSPKGELDAKIFQYKLEELTTTIAYKVQREGPQHGLGPDYVVADLYVLLRQAQQTYNLFFFLNADQRRKEDCDWRIAYSIVILPLVRTMIDCLYNITAILQEPRVKGYQFRESGYRLTLEALDADEKRYGGTAQWDEWIARQRREIEIDMRRNGFNEAQVRTAKIWLTLSGYLRARGNTPPTPHQEFLRQLTLGFWQEYSGISHATFQGLLPIAVFFLQKDLPHEYRSNVDVASDWMISLHISRVASILLCMLTELQCNCRFDGARINQRLHEIWSVLLVLPEIREFYEKRYSQLMKERGIHPE